MRTTFKKKQLSAVILLALVPGTPVFGACAPAGTTGDDTIVCSGTNTQGVDALAGNDSVEVTGGSVTSTLTNSPDTNTAVQAGAGNDQVEIDGSVTATTNNSQSSTSYTFSSSTSNPPVSDTTVSATGVGIDGGAGDDTLTNRDGVTANTTSSLGSKTIQFTLTGADATQSNTTIDATATGLRGGAGADTLSNQSSLTATTNASLNSVNSESNAGDTSHSKATTTLNSTAIGMDASGGTAAATLTNAGSITAIATTSVDNTNVEINLVDMAMADATLTFNASAAGIRTSSWEDVVSNLGNISVSSNVSVQDVSTNVSFVDATTADRTYGSAGTTLNSTAVGIDGAQAQAGQTITHSAGTISVNASSNAHALAISLASEGVPATTEVLFNSIKDQVPFASVGVTANSTATGIAGSAGNDAIESLSRISVSAGATAAQESINVGISLVDWKLPTPGIVIGSAGTGANSIATGIDGGAGNDTITNRNLVEVAASAQANAVTVSANIAGFSENVFGGPGIPLLGSFSGSLVVSDSVTATTATATGIQGGEGNDTITNYDRVNALTSSNTGVVSASGTLNIKFKEGENLFSVNAVGARAETTSDATSVSLDGGAGNDTITNNSLLSAFAMSDSYAVAATIAVAGAVKGKGGAINVAASDASSVSTANAIGVQGGAGNDTLSNNGTINATSSADALSVSAAVSVAVAKQGLVADISLARAESNAIATSIGMDSGEGHDRLQNTGTINSNADANATAVAVSVAVSGTNKGLAGGAALTDASTTASATAIGLKGGADAGVTDADLTIPTISNTGTIAINADADTTSVGASLSVSIAKEGAAIGVTLADSSTHATADASGIIGGIGDDRILNTGTISAIGQADTVAISASVSVAGTTEGFAAGVALADVSAHSNTTVVGIDGGAGNDTVRNQNLIDVHNLDASGLAVGVSIAGTFAENGLSVGAALARSGTEATAAGIGIDGNAGNDTLRNESNIRLRQISADADAVTVSLGLAGTQSGLSVAVGLAQATGEANALATGIAGGAGNDTLTNTSSITAEDISSDATAASISVALSGASNGVAAGLTIADSSATARSTAKGMDGGANDDTLTNNSSILLQRVNSESDAVSVSVSLSAAISAGVGVAGALARANANAESLAIGLDGNDGNDTITNATGSSIIVRDITAESDAIGISASIGVTNAGVALSGAVAQTTSNATSTAKGVAGGAGNDSLTNQGSIVLRNIDADAGATSVSVNVNAAIQGGVAAGFSMTDASSHANVNVTGMEGGDGNDTLSNTGTITAASGIESDAHATGVSVGLNVSFAGVAAGLSIADTSAHATTTLRGMDGGAGDDTLYNNNGILLTGRSEADGLSVAVNVSATLGIAAGGEITDASTNALTTVTGMEGGIGRDDIRNDSTLELTSIANSEASSISVGVSLGLGGDLAWADSKSTADAAVVGIGDSAGTDVASIIDNRGAMTLQATSHSTGLSVGASLFGMGLGDISNTSNASSYGIQTGDGVDHVWNTASIGATSIATTSGITVSANFGGVVHGDATTTANATATGISTSGGNDQVDNNGGITAVAVSVATVRTYNIEFAGSAEGDASTFSNATAMGIDAGAGNDQLLNRSGIFASSVAQSIASNVGVTVFGTSEGDSQTTPTGTAIGMRGGDGDDSVTNQGALTATTSAYAGVTSSSWTIAGTSDNEVGTTATANAVGLDGGAGVDSLTNRGSTFSVSASAKVDADGASWTLAGTSAHSAALTTIVQATGIDGGAGNDTLRNETAASVTALAELDVTGGSQAIFGNAGVNTQVGATATAIGLSGGADNDGIINVGALTVTSTSKVTSDRVAFSFAGSPSIDELMKSKSVALGIDGGAGNDTVYSDAAITVNSTAHASTSGRAEAQLGGGTSANGKAIGEATAIGIATGDGDDQIENRGALTVTATVAPLATNSSSAGTFFGNGDVYGNVLGTLNAAGIDAGIGNNTIVNRGSLTVNAFTLQDLLTTTAMANVHATGSGFSFGASGSGYGHADAMVNANAAGIRGGDGNNSVLNTGSIAVHIDQTLSWAYTDPNGGSSSGSGNGFSDATINATGYGIQLGNGTNVVQSDGAITVNVRPISQATSDADGTLSFNGNATANSWSNAEATGIRVGNGSYHIVSNGTINATAIPFAGSFVDTYGGTTFGDGNGYTNNYAVGKAYGIVAGNGNGYIESNAAITVNATPESGPTNDRNVHATGHGSGDAVGTILTDSRSEAVGIKTGIGTQTIVNNADLTVSANAVAAAGYGLYVDMSNPDSHRYGTVRTYAEGKATGIQTDGGNASVINRGDITVNAAPLAARRFVDGDGGPYWTEESYGVAKGIVLGAAGAPTTRSIVNDGNIQVVATGYVHGESDGCCFYPSAEIKGGVPTVVGIEVAGGGHTEIVNNGTIVANVIVSGSNLNPDPTQRSRAYGIYAVDGTHTVFNNGTIDTTRLEIFSGLAFGNGPAITLGNGDDTVGLGAASITKGNINFGAGNATLVLTGTPQLVSSSIINDTSRDFSLVLNESGQWNYTLPTAARATKNGLGTYTLPNLNSVREITVNQGTLNIANNYRFSNTGLFQASIYRDGSNGRFSADGVATLGGTLRVVSEAGVYRNDASFDVLTAAGGIAAGSTFSVVELPEATRLVTFYSYQLADRIRITTDVESFTTLGTTPDEQAVASSLDDLLANGSVEFDNLLAQAQNLTNEQASVALSSLSPAVYGFFSVAALSNSEQYANLLQERMQGQNTAALLPSGIDVAKLRAEPMRLANNGDVDLAQLFDAQDVSKERSSGMWLRGFSQRGDLNAENRMDSFEYSLTGATLGYDQRVSQAGTVGVSVGSVKNHLITDAQMSEGRVETTLVSLYGGYFDKKAYLNGALSFGRNDYDTHRNIVVGAVTTPVSSSHEGDAFSASLVGGYYGQLGESVWAGPFVSLQYTRLKEDAFSETGSPAALNVEGRVTTALVSTVGARMVGAINVDGSIWTPEFTLGWLHDHKIDDPLMNASYVGAPNTSFTVSSPAVERDGIVAGIGLGYRTQSGLTTSLKYNGQFRGDFHGHGLIGELRYEF